MSKGTIVVDEVNIGGSDLQYFSGSNYQIFAPPASLMEDERPRDFALLLTDYIRLDGTKVLLPGDAWPPDGATFSYTQANLTQLLDNLRALRGLVVNISPFTPEVPESFERPTTETANDIERILYDIWQYLLSNPNPPQPPPKPPQPILFGQFDKRQFDKSGNA